MADACRAVEVRYQEGRLQECAGCAAVFLIRHGPVVVGGCWFERSLRKGLCASDGSVL